MDLLEKIVSKTKLGLAGLLLGSSLALTGCAAFMGSAIPYQNVPQNQSTQPQNQQGLQWYDGKLDTGNHYKGTILNGKPYGDGVLISTTLVKYEGDFKEGLPNGQGTFTLRDKTSFIGEFKDGKLTDNIRLIFPEGYSDTMFYTSREDFNRDGLFELTELRGITKELQTNQSAVAYSLWAGSPQTLEGKAITLDIINPKTNQKLENYGRIELDPDNIVRIAKDNPGIWIVHHRINPKEIKEKLGGENLKAIWKMDGTPKKETDFKIIGEIK